MKTKIHFPTYKTLFILIAITGIFIGAKIAYANPSIQINMPTSNSVVEGWNEVTDTADIQWNEADTCSYNFDGGTQHTVDCSDGGTDIGAPSSAGTHTLNLTATNHVGTTHSSVTFSYLYSGGAGTASDPLHITSCAQLMAVTDINSQSYILENDLTCSSQSFPIEGTFIGTLDGNGHNIAYNLDNIPDSETNLGLFNQLGESLIENLSVSLINGDTMSGTGNMGMIAAATTGDDRVRLINDSSATDVTSTAEGEGGNAGGLIGTAQNVYVYDNVTYTGTLTGGTGNDDRFGVDYDNSGTVPSPTITTPADGSNITSWDPDIDFDSDSCLYSFDGGAYHIARCGDDGSDIPSPGTGSHTISLKSVNNDSIPVTVSSTFTITTPAIIAIWNLDDNPQTTHPIDTSGNNNTGMFVGSPDWTPGLTSNNGDNGLRFDGASHVSTPVAFPTSGTVALWADPTSVNNFQSPGGWKHEVGDGGYALIDEGTGSWRAVFKPDESGADEVDVTDPDPIDLNQWTSLVMTWSLSGSTYTIHLYVNGEDQGSATWTGTPGATIGTFAFGDAGVTDDNGFVGYEDQIGILNAAVSADDAMNFYNGATPTTPSTAGKVKVTVTDSDSNPVAQAAVYAACSDDFNQFSLLGTTDSNGVIEADPTIADGSNCTDQQQIAFKVQKSGYATTFTGPEDAIWDQNVDPEDPSTFYQDDNSITINNTYAVTAAAADAFSNGGDGTSESPYQISSCAELQEINNNLGADYQLTTDLTCTGENDFFPLARQMNDIDNDPSDPAPGFVGFTGTLDGQGHSITYAINIGGDGQDTVDYLGLFGFLGPGSTVENLTVHTATPMAVGGVSGILAGIAVDATVEHVSSDGAITVGSVTNSQNIGGLIGLIDQEGTGTNNISNNTFSGTIAINNNDTNPDDAVLAQSIGGIAGGSEIDGNGTTTMNGNTFDGSITASIWEIEGVSGIVGYADALQQFSNNSSTAGSSISLTAIDTENDYAVNSVGMLGGEIDFVNAAVQNNTAAGTVNVNGIAAAFIGGAFGTIEDSAINNNTSSVTITAHGGGAGQAFRLIGGFAGITDGTTMDTDSATGNVSVTGIVTEDAVDIGGLVGDFDNENNDEYILSNSFATGDVTVSADYEVEEIGGLAGSTCKNSDGCTLINNHATGNVTATSTDTPEDDSGWVQDIGGLVGRLIGFDDYNESDFTSDSKNYATGNVTVINHADSQNQTIYIGGLAGSIDAANTDQSYATGSVTVTTDNNLTGASPFAIGGFVGMYISGDTLSNSYASGPVTLNTVGGQSNGDDPDDGAGGGLGGFSGVIAEIGTISNSYSSGAVHYNILNGGMDSNGDPFDGEFLGIAGFAGSTNNLLIFANDFTTSAVSAPAGSNTVAGFAGFTNVVNNGEGNTYADDLFDVTKTGQTACAADDTPDGCTGINTDGSDDDHFIDNSTNTPFNAGEANWDFGSIWQTSTSYPQLQFAPVISDDGGGDQGGGDSGGSQNQSGGGGGGSTGGTITGGSLPTTTVSNGVTICPVGDIFSATTGLRCTAFSGVTPPTVSSNTTPYHFPRTLKSGSVGPDVKILQQFLNAHGAIVSTSGAGSAGQETTSFAAKTKTALMKYQKTNGLQVDGILGPKSRAFIEAIMNA